MANAIIIILVFLMLPLFVGSIFLQIILSKKKNKLFGLILPIITLLIPILLIIVSYVVNKNNNNGMNSIAFTSIWMVMYFNIPIVIYIGIYLGYSKYRKALSNKSHDELIKMNIQDLE